MADEQAPAAEPRRKAAVVSMRFRNEKEAEEFFEVLTYRMDKGKSKDASDFIRQMFNYLKNDPHGDFKTGR
ncbi:hypothetical protein [Hymenobacter saemangeumensis]